MNSVGAATQAAGLPLPDMHASAHAICTSAVMEGKACISIVAALSFILETLPKTAKAEQVDQMKQHLNQFPKTGSRDSTPTNLIKHLEQGLKQSTIKRKAT